jgi:membrane protein implicated in regulation of membrane protease activity
LLLLRLALPPIFVGALILVQQIFSLWIGVSCLLIGGGLLYLAWKY